MIHYYASPGIDELSADDYLTSQYPYARQAERFETMFFNYCNRNDGQTWSTPFVIDDPRLYIVRSQRVLAIVNQKKQHIARQKTLKKQAELQRAKEQRMAERAAAQRDAQLIPKLGDNRIEPAPEPTPINLTR